MKWIYSIPDKFKASLLLIIAGLFVQAILFASKTLNPQPTAGKPSLN